MKIGFISDTHGILPGPIFDIFKDVKHLANTADLGVLCSVFSSPPAPRSKRRHEGGVPPK